MTHDEVEALVKERSKHVFGFYDRHQLSLGVRALVDGVPGIHAYTVTEWSERDKKELREMLAPAPVAFRVTGGFSIGDNT